MHVLLSVLSSVLLVASWASAAERLSAFHQELFLKTTWLPSASTVEYRISSSGILTKTKETPSIKDSSPVIQQRQITSEAWEKFKASVSALKLETWQSEYRRPRDGTFHYDGYFWEMSLVFDGVLVRSMGQNAGPDPTNPNKTILPEESGVGGDRLLDQAFETLLIDCKEIQ